MAGGGITATTSEEISVGAGDGWYKDEDGIWQPVGATQDNNVWRVNTTYFAPDFNGATGPLKGTDYITEQIAELEVTLPQIGEDKLALALPGSVVTTETAAAVVGGGAGVLDAPIAIGQWETIGLDVLTNLSVGDYVKVGPVGAREIRRLTRVGVSDVDVDFPFMLAHAIGETFSEVNGTGAVHITPATQRRIPSSAYHDWRLDVPGLDGRMVRFFLFDGIMTDNAEFEAADDGNMAPRLTIASRIDPAQMERGGWEIMRVPVAS